MRPAALPVLALLVACGGTAAPTLTATPPKPSLLAGAPAVVVLRADQTCPDLGDLSVTALDGAATPAWLDVAVDRFLVGVPPLANPGGGGASRGGEAATCFGCYLPVASPGGRLFYSAPFDGYQVVLTAAASAPAGPVPLAALATGCGRTWRAALTPVVTGVAADLAGFCGWSTGEACAADADCARAGAWGQICAPEASGPTAALAGLDCSDPVVPGARCGCEAGTCAWRLPP